MPKCTSPGCAKWATVGQQFCRDHLAASPAKEVKKHLQSADVSSPALDKKRHMNEGSLANFMAKSLGVQHSGRSTGLIKATFHDEEAANYHGNKAANREMAKAFADMVMATKGQDGRIKLPSKIIEEKNKAKLAAASPEKSPGPEPSSPSPADDPPPPPPAEPLPVDASPSSSPVRSASASSRSASSSSSSAGGEKKNISSASEKAYPYRELKTAPFPEGVDASKREDHLYDWEFEEIFKMKRSEFTALPGWKKTKLRQDAELY